MKSLIVTIAAVTYALTLWMFAPQSRWERELETAKANQQRLTPTPEAAPETALQTSAQLESAPDTLLDTAPEPELEPEPTPEPQAEPIHETAPDTVEQAIQPDYTMMTINQLRELAKQRKLNWRPLVNGKRSPLKKPQLIALLAA